MMTMMLMLDVYEVSWMMEDKTPRLRTDPARPDLPCNARAVRPFIAGVEWRGRESSSVTNTVIYKSKVEKRVKTRVKAGRIRESSSSN